MPGVHPIDPKVGLQSWLRNGWRVVSRDIEGNAVGEAVESVSVRDVVDIVGTEAVLYSKLDRVGAGDVRSRSVPEVSVSNVVTVHSSSRTASEERHV